MDACGTDATIGGDMARRRMERAGVWLTSTNTMVGTGAGLDHAAGRAAGLRGDGGVADAPGWVSFGMTAAPMVGHDRAFLERFFKGAATAYREVFTPMVIDGYLRTLAGVEGVLGSLGICRAAFTSIAQTEPLLERKVTMPFVALGGVNGLGGKVGETVAMVAQGVEALVRSAPEHLGRTATLIIDGARHAAATPATA